MLPLMQMHPMVPTPPHFDHLLPGSNHIKPEYLALCQQSRNPMSSNPYATQNVGARPFPIRSSQPAQPPQQQQSPHRGPSALSFAQSHPQALPDYSQHQLRRKTPSGTIDAGYDGSPAGLAIGPPQKQLIISASPKIFPTAFVHSNLQMADAVNGQLHLASSWQYSHSAQRIGGGYDAQPVGWNLGQSLQPDGAPLPDRIMAPQQHPSNLFSNDLRLQGVFTPSYQHNIMSPTAFNPAGFTPSPVWKDPGVSDYRGQVPLSNLGFIPQNAAFDATYVPAQNSMHQPIPMGQQMLGGPVQGHAMHAPMPGFDADNGVLRPPQNVTQLPRGGLESLSLRGSAAGAGSPVGGLPMRSDMSSPARFKERVLAHAHKTYADLLVYISYTKQSLPGKTMSGLRTLSKMVVFPKPPKQLGLSLSPPRHTAAMHARHGSFAGAESAFGASGQAKFAYADRTYRAGSGNPAELPSPVSSARQSLEMLTNLCEQSGWKWVDGMLLGGCLHYGLEHYEEALDWFKRITNLDSSHVETISNIAATLYCLNRHDEAERHWVEAVTLRPGYLEAVEHLVGLLCSTQRSRQAVNIISRVQRGLRMPEHEPSQGDAASQNIPPSSQFAEASTQPGFGSSGYMIPGNENGRMLLLIHAKGNMLYALKDIERASEAFEEVVMISTGRQNRGIQSLIREIQTVLSPRPSQLGMPSTTGALVRRPVSGPLLLPPDRAKLTARFVFGSANAQLPGLRYVGEGGHRKSAVSTTSNSLLSLAKIFQDSMSTGGMPPGQGRQASGVGDILALYYLSLSLQESPSTANNVGILLASVQQSAAQIEPLSPESAALVKDIPGIVRGSGLELALLYYQYGLTLDPHHVHLHTNLGSLLKDIGQLDLAIQMYERAVACDGTFDIALTNLANAVKDRGRISDAIMYYKRAVTTNPDFAEAVCGLSTALNSVCDWRGRGGVYLYGARFDRWHVDEQGMLQDVRNSGQGSGLMKRVVDIVGRQLQDSASWGAGTLGEAVIALLVSQLKSSGAKLTNSSMDLEAELRKWADQPWEGSRIIRLIERATRSAMRTWYVDKYVKGQEAAGGYPRPRLPGSLTIPSAPTVLPFHTFTCPLTARDIRTISQRNAHRISCSTLRAPWLSSSVYPPPPPPQPYLNVGYLSSDFNNHPLAHLMQSVFGFHDQTRVKAFCYATTASDKSIHRQQIEREAPVFRDVSSWPPDKLVNQIVRDGIHILVNLNGYTRGARNEIFAARPAPIQMSFMGFAGTLGAEWCDYLLADATAVPPSTLRPWRGNNSLQDVFKDEAVVDDGEWVYSENIIYCKDTFFCCDHAQSADVEDERNMSWEEEQRRRWKMRKELFPNLPDDTIILGNFNQLYKIDPTTFRAWLRILAAVPKAILWLLRFPDLGEVNLKRTAKEWAGEQVANRILFTDVAPKQQHISRARVCDLFLDTPECNAHTTAADILWSSTPLLTLPRYEYKMCSRMAASILKGALPNSEEGLRAASDLVAEDDVDYENLAVKLANGLSYQLNVFGGYGEGAGRLAELRRLLWESKWTCALFDTRRWVRDLEDAYDEAWRRWVAGEGGDIHL
ncbi:hypothetical protein RB601_004930 [Gaeumannomyces tritici]